MILRMFDMIIRKVDMIIRRVDTILGRFDTLKLTFPPVMSCPGFARNEQGYEIWSTSS